MRDDGKRTGFRESRSVVFLVDEVVVLGRVEGEGLEGEGLLDVLEQLEGLRVDRVLDGGLLDGLLAGREHLCEDDRGRDLVVVIEVGEGRLAAKLQPLNVDVDVEARLGAHHAVLALVVVGPVGRDGGARRAEAPSPFRVCCTKRGE